MPVRYGPREIGVDLFMMARFGKVPLATWNATTSAGASARGPTYFSNNPNHIFSHKAATAGRAPGKNPGAVKRGHNEFIKLATAFMGAALNEQWSLGRCQRGGCRRGAGEFGTGEQASK